MSRDHVELVRRSLEGWNRGDFEAWAEGSHPQVAWSSDVALHMGGADAVYHGREGLRRYWDEWQAIWKMQVEVTEIRDLGDRVFALGRVRTHGQASGVDLEQDVGYLFRFEDGMVRDARSFLDPEEARAAAGLSG